MARPGYRLEVGFGSVPDEPVASTIWTDITAYLDVKAGVRTSRGRTDEQGDVQPSKLSLTLDNRDGRFTKGNPGSPYWPNVRTGVRIRFGLVWAGTTYWRFTGDVDEWPTSWVGGPAAYAECRLSATDRLKRLGDLAEFGPLHQEVVLSAGPAAYWPLQEDAAASTAGDVSGNDETPLAPTQVGVSGELRFGESPGTGNFYAESTTAGFNPASVGNGQYLRATLRRPLPAGGPGLSVVALARESAAGVLPTGPLVIVTAPDGSWFGVTKVASGNCTASYYDAGTDSRYDVVSGIGFTVDRSELFAAVLDVPSPGNGRITFYAVDGDVFGSPVTFPLTQVPSIAAVSVGGRGKEVFRGNISHVAVYAAPVAATALDDQHAAAFGGNTDRYAQYTYYRLSTLCAWTGLGTLGWYNGGGTFTPQRIGPQQIAGDPLAAMRLIEATEDGLFYLRGDGTPVLQLRSTRLNAAPTLTLAASRLDPDALTFRGDDYGVVNDVTARRVGGAEVRVVNETSRAAVGRRKASIDTAAFDDQAARLLAAWRANTYGADRNRVTGVRISLLNDPSLLPAALTLTPGLKVAVTGLPGQAPAAALELFVEGWDETVGEDEWSMELSTSSGEAGDVWQFGVPGRSEIGTTTRIGP